MQDRVVCTSIHMEAATDKEHGPPILLNKRGSMGDPILSWESNDDGDVAGQLP